MTGADRSVAPATADFLRRALGAQGVEVQLGPCRVRLRSDVDGVAEYLARLYADFPMRDGDEGHFDLAVVGGRGLHRWIRPQAVAVINGHRPFFPLPARLGGALIEWSLNWCIGRNAHRWTVLHAAVVERGGRAMLFPAPPESGKSTLCAALTYSGWRLFSDEFAIVEPETLQVLPLPRPISLKERAIDIIRARHPDVVFGPEGRDMSETRFAHARPPAESVRRSSEPAPTAWIVTPRYVAGSATNFTPVAKAEALMQIADQSFNYNFLGTSGFQCLVDLVRRAACYRLEYSDLDDAIGTLGRLTES